MTESICCQACRSQGDQVIALLFWCTDCPFPFFIGQRRQSFNPHDENVHLQLSARTKQPSINTPDLDTGSVEVTEVFVPISLIDGADELDIPQQMFLPDPIQAEDIERELAQMGWVRHVYVLQNTGFAFCVPLQWKCEAGAQCFVYHPIGCCDRSEIILHQTTEPLSEIKHMQLLHSLGFCRAVIVSQNAVRSGLTLIQYHNNQPALDAGSGRPRSSTPWPKPMPTFQSQPFFEAQKVPTEVPKHRLDFGASLDDLQDFFQSSADVLCPWYSHLDMPEVTRKAMTSTASTEAQTFSISDFDRLIIYTDGSSKSQNRRKPPLRVQEQDVPDAWAFVVLGEKYTSTHGEVDLTLLGWHEEQLTHYLGTTQIAQNMQSAKRCSGQRCGGFPST